MLPELVILTSDNMIAAPVSEATVDILAENMALTSLKNWTAEYVFLLYWHLSLSL